MLYWDQCTKAIKWFSSSLMVTSLPFLMLQNYPNFWFYPNAVNDIVAQTMNNILNRPFTSSEIMNTIKSLKNNTAVGIDSIRNEYIKSSSDKLVHIYEKKIITILNLGVVPESCSIGIIKPLDKKQR